MSSAPTKIVVSPQNATIPLGGSVQLTPALYDVNGNPVTPTQPFIYKSGNPNLLTVNSDGLCTAASLVPGTLQTGGIVEIEVTYSYGLTIYTFAAITVSAAPAVSVDHFYKELQYGVSGGVISPIARVVPSE